MTFPEKCCLELCPTFLTFLSVYFQGSFWSLKGVKFLLPFGLYINCRCQKLKPCRQKWERGQLLADIIKKSGSSSGITWLKGSDDVLRNGFLTPLLCPCLCYLPFSPAGSPLALAKASSRFTGPPAEQPWCGGSRRSGAGSPPTSRGQSLNWCWLPVCLHARVTCLLPGARGQGQDPQTTRSQKVGKSGSPEKKH